MIKYLGSKRLIVPRILREVTEAAGIPAGAVPTGLPGAGPTILDLFSGTSRVGHALKRAGFRVLANDHNAYAAALARCYVQADRQEWADDAARLVAELGTLPPRAGFFTETFCVRSRFVHPNNGERIDAIREAIASKSLEPELESVLLVALMEAADRVDSTTGVQMAYLKSWAPRAHRPLELRVPELLPRAAAGKGRAFMLDAADAAATLEADVAYIDPPYNQHSYLGNYHVWETLVRWDRPAVYGVACKREDCRTRRSAFNSRRGCAAALRRLLERVRAKVLIVSLSDEGYVSRSAVEAMLARRGRVRTIEIDYPRYIGAKIGIYNPRGEKVGEPGRLRNTEYLFVVDTRQDPRDATTTGEVAAESLVPDEPPVAEVAAPPG